MVTKKGTDVLDQDEVMKAMLAQAAAKRSSASDGGDSGSDSGSDDDDSDDESASGSDEDDRPANGAMDSDESDEEIKNDDGDDSDDEEAKDEPPAKPSAPAPTLSRVQAARSAASSSQPTPKSDKDVFSTPRVDTSASFASLGLSQPAITALAHLNIKKPTEIQVACIPPILAGRDCIGGAKTGSGKTLAFALPILESIARDPFGIWAVVLTPTRELAYQLAEQFMAVGKPLGLSTVTVVGGMDMLSQAQALQKRPHVVVATPGRLCDLLRSDGVGANPLARVRALVLDEADRMLTPTFAPELAYLFSVMPKNRQTLLFTATISEPIMDLAKKPPPPGKQVPFVYRVTSDTLTVAKLTQKYLFIPSQVRDAYLYYLLLHPPSEIDAALRAAPKPKKEAAPKKGRGKRVREESPEEEAPPVPSTIIFAQRTATAHLLHLMLNELGIPSVALHSGLTQPERLLSLARFRAREIPVLVTTDVGSRGLDIPEVALVVNWDCPRQADDYVHRVGRTARAGRGGVAITMVTERDTQLLPFIEKNIGTTLGEYEMPEDPVLENLNKVSTARRLASMEMHDSDFGERKAVNKAKAIKRARRDAKARGE